MSRSEGLGPPWIIYSDRGKSVAILPAGRPGEVANVKALPDDQVRRIVEAANSREQGFYTRLHELTERVLERTETNVKLDLLDEIEQRLKARSKGGQPNGRAWPEVRDELREELTRPRSTGVL